MTFGPTPHDRFPSTPFGAGPSSDRFDPYGGARADGFGGYGAPPDGFGGRAAPHLDVAGPEQLAVPASAMLRPRGDVEVILAETHLVMDGKRAADALLAEVRAGLPASVAVGRFAAIVQDLAPTLQHLAAIRARHVEAMTGPAALAPLTRTAVADEQRSIARALDTSTPRVLDALNNLTRVGLELEPDLRGRIPAAPGSAALASAMARVAEAGAPFGWAPPGDWSEVEERRRDHEACPLGANADAPTACHLSDAERVRLQGSVRLGLRDAATAFRTACGPFQRELQDAIAREIVVSDFVASTFVEGVVAAVRVFGGGDPFLTTWGGDIAKSARRAFFRPAASPELTDQVTALESLATAVESLLREVDERILAFDDHSLQRLELVLRQMGPKDFTPHIAAFTRRYRAQIVPIGKNSVRDATDPFHSAVSHESAWIQLGPDRRRLARISRPLPGVPVGPVRPVDGVSRDREIRFEAWIDDDLHDAARADEAQVIHATEVADLPLADLVSGAR